MPVYKGTDASDNNLTISTDPGGRIGIRAFGGDDSFTSFAFGRQIHIYAGAGNDDIRMDFRHINIKSSELVGGHHARGDGFFADLAGEEKDMYNPAHAGNDTFRFENYNHISGTVAGRLEDFDYTRDTLVVGGQTIDLMGPLPSHVRVVSYNGEHNDPGTAPQQWLLIETNAGGHIFYALEGARVDMNDDGLSNEGNQERHFLDVIPDFSTLVDVNYMDSQNYVPAGYVAEGGETINDIDDDFRDVNAAITGTSAGDLIAGGLNDDVIHAGDGNDRVWGGTENDLINGESGNDTAIGGMGDDTLNGGLGADRLEGGVGNDSVSGGDGNDEVLGHAGDDFLDGGTGDDTISASDGNDTVYGGEGNDSLGGGFGHDSVYGGAGNDIIGSGSGHDMIDAGSGDDNISGGWGYDTLYGGSGNDTMAGSFDADLLFGESGNDNMGGGTGNDTIYGGDGHDTVGAGDDHDAVWGQAGNDFLAGGAGNDTLRGGAGDDQLNGGTGNDALQGGGGSDEFIFNSLTNGETDVIWDFENGIDQIRMHGVSGVGMSGRFNNLDISSYSGGAQIEYGGHTIRLEGVSVSELDVSDFIFI